MKCYSFNSSTRLEKIMLSLLDLNYKDHQSEYDASNGEINPLFEDFGFWHKYPKRRNNKE